MLLSPQTFFLYLFSTRFTGLKFFSIQHLPKKVHSQTISISKKDRTDFSKFKFLVKYISDIFENPGLYILPTGIINYNFKQPVSV